MTTSNAEVEYSRHEHAAHYLYSDPRIGHYVRVAPLTKGHPCAVCSRLADRKVQP